MLVSYNWLKDYLNISMTPDDLANEVTLTGIEVPEVIHPEAGLKKIVAGKVLELTKHPDSDHLNIAQVDVGEGEPIQIVCGAPNIRQGQTVIVALHGARIANNEKIKRGKMRGVESNGMICSLQEIGFSESVVPKKYADGIYVFEEEIAPGTIVFDTLGMNDYILDFDITPNRADTLSMYGSAYEVGAIVYETPKINPVELTEELPDWTNELTVQVDDNLVDKYYLRKISDVKITDSPMWMQTRLMNAGIRPINNIVDITNYVMLTTGQPLHAFDFASVTSKKLNVMLAKNAQELILLNGQKVQLDPEDLVIFDDETPIGFAGVMGGLESEITEKTNDVLLESAIFDGGHVRKTAQRHNLRSEASNRFEKGIDPDSTIVAINMAASLLNQYATAKTHQNVLFGADKKVEPLVISLTTKRVNHILGTNLTTEEIVEIFDRLNFATTVKEQEITVNVPARRFDIHIEADLIEEIARIYGYDKLPQTLPTTEQTLGGYDSKQQFLNKIEKLMIASGANQTINYSLTDDKKATEFTLPPAKTPIAVEWPLNSDRTTMRQNLVSGLFDTLVYNTNHHQNNLQLFEIGRIFYQEDGKNIENEHVAGVYLGQNVPDNWQHQSHEIDFYDVRGVVENIFAQLNLADRISFIAKNVVHGMHPTRIALITLDDQIVGYVGQISPILSKVNKIKDVYAFEINLESVFTRLPETKKAQKAPKFPSIRRDLSLLVDKNISNGEISAVIAENGGKYLVKTSVFDVYQGDKLPDDKKSISYQLTFYNSNETLTDEIVKESFDKIINALTHDLEIVIR